jgi:hypothetical protein
MSIVKATRSPPPGTWNSPASQSKRMGRLNQPVGTILSALHQLSMLFGKEIRTNNPRPYLTAAQRGKRHNRNRPSPNPICQYTKRQSQSHSFSQHQHRPLKDRVPPYWIIWIYSQGKVSNVFFHPVTSASSFCTAGDLQTLSRVPAELDVALIDST